MDVLNSRILRVNLEKLRQLNPKFQPKVKAVLLDLAGKGWQPIIADAWRSPAEQMLNYRRGYSKVTFSFHNCCDPLTGNADALAADIVDARWYWNMPLVKRLLFIKHIVSSCRAHELQSGALWKMRDWAHCETKAVTLAEAKAGKRP